MSYILEALKKSEQERQIGHVPDLSMVQEASPRLPARRPRWLVPVLLLNALLLAVIAWRPWDMSGAPWVDHQAAPASTAAAATVEKVPVANVPAPPQPHADALPVTAAPMESTPMGSPPAAALPAPVTQMPPPAPEPLFEEPAEPVAAEAEPELAPRWEDLTAEERSGLPAPRIDVHVFAREPARRFVLINLRKYQEGDTIDDGATLETILADGIVLSYQGRRYRMDRP